MTLIGRGLVNYIHQNVVYLVCIFFIIFVNYYDDCGAPAIYFPQVLRILKTALSARVYCIMLKIVNKRLSNLTRIENGNEKRPN